MIGCSKLLCGTATVSEAIKYSGQEEIPPQLLQFSAQNRPLVVWNVTRRCNLRCRHCYIDAEDKNYDQELSTEEARIFINDLADMRVPVLLFSGGEPLLRKDIFELGALAAKKGLRPVISTNGTLINDEIAKKIKAAGFQYVGVSIDGMQATHDNFRNKAGAFEQALKGIRACINNGIKTGIRFTVNKYNIADLPAIIELLQREKIPRFCMYHLVYAGRGAEMMEMDISLQEKRELINWLGKKAIELHAAGVETEILTTDNHADGIFFYQQVKKNQPERAEEILHLLEMHGGCSAGTKFANVDHQGNVHPCQFWQDYTVGNIREQPFSQLWNSDDALMVKLRQKNAHLKEQCGECDYNHLCGGCRIRARAVHGDLWSQDPACYLTAQEIQK
jgi:radical SAM protein with 4Fe4S-binding SPASM domain